MTRRWLIVNLGELLPDAIGDECIIPHGSRPSYVHETREDAELEALRLHESYGGPLNSFVVFEAVAYTEWRRPFIKEAKAVACLELFEKPKSHHTKRRKVKS